MQYKFAGSSRRLTAFCVVMFVLLFFAAPSAVLAAPFTPGNIVVYRVGTGTGTLVNTGNPVFLDEYTPDGTLVQSIALPTTASGAQKQLVAGGTAASEGLLTRSTDGRYLLLTGYAANIPYATSLSGTAATTVTRVVGRVDANGSIDTSTALTDFASGNNPRSAVSTDGTTIWATGGTGIHVATFGSTTSTQLATTNSRQGNIFAGQLYLSSGSGTNTFRGVNTVGTGLPTTSGQTIARLPGLTDTTNPSTYGFFFADLTLSVAGVDTLYVADDAAGALRKFSLVSSSWTSNGIIGADADDYRGLTGIVSGTTVTLYATRKGGSGVAGGGELVTLTDASGYNGAFAGTPTVLATATTNSAFRGVALAPIVLDTPPQVIATTPISNATSVAVDSALTLTFNESVDLTAGAVTLECPAGTGITLAGLPANDVITVTLAPGSALPNSTSCTVTAVAANITDNEGTPHQLDGNGDGTGGDDFVFSFTTDNDAVNPPSTIDLSTYVRIGRYDLPVPARTTAPAGSELALEVSTVTYNPNTDTLFVLGDEGTSVVQVTKQGQLVDSMTLTLGDFADPEGLTYVSGSQFVLVEERLRQANLFTYVAGGTLARANVQSVKLGTTVGNIGLEGLSSDPQTGGFILVKETSPQGIFQSGIDFGAGTATNGSPSTENSTNLFDPALAALTDIADVYALSNLPAPLTDDNLLVLSQEDGKIVNLDRTGTLANALTIAADPDNPLSVANQGNEGVTLDNAGLLYVVNEQGGGDSQHPQLWVYASASYVYANAAPVAVSLSNVTASLAENSSTAARIQVGTIIISDDALGTNSLSLSGADAAVFEIEGTKLFLKAGAVLDFETKPIYAVTVNVDDAGVGAAPDASTNFTLEITDATENPATLIVSEVAPWSSGNSPGVAADWFEVTNVSTGTIDITGWKIDDDSASFANASALSGVTSIAPDQSAIFVDGDATKITAFVNTWFGGTLPTGVLIGTYGGPGLGTGGDAVNLFDAGGALVTGVAFGASPAASPFATFDNAAGLPAVSTLSVVGVNGAFSVIDVGVNAAAVLIGSPGTIAVAPVPTATLVGIAATDAAAAEAGQNPGTFTILRTGTTTAALAVSYSIGGSATNGTDYTPTLTGAVTIPAGASLATITITPVDDALAEATEAITLTLVDTADYDLAANASSATVTIADNDSAVANFNLQVTEIWPGNSVGANLTADWFEITNSGTEAWVAGVAPDLYYDDSPPTPANAVLISGITQLDPGESVVVVVGSAAAAQTFTSVWGSVIDLTGIEIGFTAGAGLGANGDGVGIFVGLPGTGAVPVDFESYPAGSVGQSYDVALAAFSVAGQNGAVATAPNDGGQSAVGSPGHIFTAPPPGQAFPLSEGFDSCPPAPTGWTIVSVDADTANTWFCGGSVDKYVEGNGFGDTVAADEWLITPALNMNAQTSEGLSFRSATSFSDSGQAYPQLSVLYSTDYSGSGNPTTATWTPLTGTTFSPSGSGSFVESGVIDLSSITGTNVYFAFRYLSSGTGSGTAARWRVDTVSFVVDTNGPAVSTLNPADGAAGVAVGQDLVVTFNETVQKGTGNITIHLAADNSVVQTIDVTSANVTVTGAQATINPPADLAVNTAYYVNIAAGAIKDMNSNNFAGITDATTWNFTTSAPTITKISAIQGSGSSVTGAGPFIVEAIVVGDYQTQGSGQLRGFFLQEEDADADANATTSEGIFVFCSACPTPVAVGDKVQVTGSASEFSNMSQLTASTAGSLTVLSAGNPLPTPATVQLPVPGLPSGNLATATTAINAYFEPFEGMLVTFPDTLAVSEYFELARYGQVILNEGGRPYQFTNINPPSVTGLVNHEIDLAGRTVILDDTDNRENRPIDTPNTNYYHPVPGLSTSNFFRGSDTITNLTGVLHWSWAGLTGTDAWRIRPVTPQYSYAFTPVTTRPAVPSVGGALKVASFNVLNYFLTIDTTSSSSSGACGASATLDCRGADNTIERDQQQAKLTAALNGLDADIFGLIELENTPNVDPLAEIVADLNAVAGAGTYATINTGVVGTDAIKVGFIYKPAAVTPIGSPMIDTNAVHNRPPVAQLFETANGGRFTVVVNHFKSKGCTDATGANTDQLDGQGCYNAQRVEQANALLSFVSTITTQTGDPDVLIIGDLNAYAKEDPITTLQNAGFTNLVAQFGGASAYSYVFDGQLGYLDHALANASLTAQVTGVAEWHINADEIPLFDYNDDVKDTGEATFEEESDTLPLYAANAFRTSDHDPVVVGLNLLGKYAVTVSAEPVAGGTATGGGIFSHGDTVTVTATANSGYTFVHWMTSGGAVSANAVYTFTATANRTLTATFGLNSYGVVTATDGTGSGSVSLDPAGGTYTHGTVVTATANAATGSTFSGWSGDCSGTGDCVLTVDSAKHVTATFSLNTVYALDAYPAQPGILASGSVIVSATLQPAEAGRLLSFTLVSGAGSLSDVSAVTDGSGVAVVTYNAPATTTIAHIAATLASLPALSDSAYVYVAAGTGAGQIQPSAGGVFTVGNIVDSHIEIVKIGAGTPTMGWSEFTGNPCPASAPGSKVVSPFVDVLVEAVSGVDAIVVTIKYTDTVNAAQHKLFWCNIGVWQQVTGTVGNDLVQQTMVFTITGATAPSLLELEGTAFVAGVNAPAVVAVRWFTATALLDHVQLTWQTQNEIGLHGFHLYRGPDAAGPGERITAEPVPAQGMDTLQGFDYVYDDFTSLPAATALYYWLEELHSDGSSLRHGPQRVSEVGSLRVYLPVVSR